jgi:hypothetical protein
LIIEENFPIEEILLINSCGEAVRPSSEQIRVEEAGRTAPLTIWDKNP